MLDGRRKASHQHPFQHISRFIRDLQHSPPNEDTGVVRRPVLRRAAFSRGCSRIFCILGAK